MKRFFNFLALFGSMSTLICCALPALFVTLGLGATFAGFLHYFPQLIWFSENKGLVFGVGGFFLILAAISQYRARFEPCPIDPKLAAACEKSRKWSKRILIFSSGLYGLGGFFAFIAPHLV